MLACLAGLSLTSKATMEGRWRDGGAWGTGGRKRQRAPQDKRRNEEIEGGVKDERSKGSGGPLL